MRWDGYDGGGCRLRGAEGYTDDTDGRLASPMCSSDEEMEMGGEKASRSVDEWTTVVWDAG